jgi:SAM-dependent methyltransferase
VRRLLGGRDVLEVGCGIGRNLAHLAPRAIGVDHNEASIAICRERGLTAYTGDEFATSADARPGRFDGLLAAHLIEHMPRGEAIRVLAGYLPYVSARARLVLICPQERGYASDATHVEFAGFDELAEACAALGFTPVRRISFPFPRPLGRLFTHNEFVLVGERAGATGTP